MIAASASEQASFYVTGGTLPLDAPSYIVRQADRALYAGLAAGEFCYVLDTRQMGKSSLMIRTGAQLRELGATVAVLDLTAIGQNLTPDRWYAGLLDRLAEQIGLEEELLDYWRAHKEIGPMQRFVGALRLTLVILAQRREGNELSPALVLFLDEIDAVRSLPFAVDEFFAGLRECYNRRTTDPLFHGLAVCLLGVATPSDLIQDTRISPFNIGRRILLTDFTAEEASPLAAGLALPGRMREGRRLLGRVLYWTGGHPYMTQRLCRVISERAIRRSPTLLPICEVDGVCRQLFLSKQARDTDDNLAFVRNRLLRSEVDLAALLDLYRQVGVGRRVADDETNLLCSVMRLSGVVRARSGFLQVRNRIYAHVFDAAWVQNHMPGAELRRQRAAYRRGAIRAACIGGAVATVFSTLALLAFRQTVRANGLRADAQKAHQQLQALLSQRYTAEAQAHLDADDSMGAAPPLLAAMNLDQADTHRMEMHAWRLAMTREGFPRLTHLFACGGPVVWAAFAPGERVMAAAAGREIRLWEGATGRALPTLPQSSTVTDAIFSPDGAQLAVGCGDGSVNVWNIATGKLALPPLRCPGPVQRVVWSPNGALIAAGYDCGAEAQCVETTWNARTGAVRYRAEMLYSCYDLAFSPDSRRLIVAPADYVAAILDAETGKPLCTAGKTYGGERPSIVFSPDGGRFLLRGTSGGGNGSNARLVDLKTGRAATTQFRCSGPSCYSPDGKLLAVADDLDVQILDASTGKALRGVRFHHELPITALAFSPNGALLLTASRDGSVGVWDPATGKLARQRMHHAGPVRAAVFDRAGCRVLSAGEDGTVRLWDLAPVQPLRHVAWIPMSANLANLTCVGLPDGGHLLTLQGANGNIQLLDSNSGRILTGESLKNGVWKNYLLSDDCHRILLSGEDAQHHPMTQTWDVVTGSPVSSPILYPGHTLKEILLDNPPRLSPDGRRYIILAGKERSELRDVVTGRVLATLPCLPDAVRFSADGTRLLTCSQDRLQIRSTEDGQAIAPPLSASKRRMTVGLSAHGRCVICLDEDNRLTLYEAATGEVRMDASVFLGEGRRPGEPGFFLGSFLGSPDERHLVLWTQAGWALIDTANFRVVQRQVVPLTPLWGFKLTFRPDSERLIITDNALTILCDTNSGKTLLSLPHGVALSHFSPDGKQIAWAVESRVNIYNTDSGKLEQSLEHPAMATPPWPKANPCVWFNSTGRLLLTNSTDGMARLWDPATGERIGPPIQMPGLDGVTWFMGTDRLLLTPSIAPQKIATDPPAHLLALPPPLYSTQIAALLARLSAPSDIQDGLVIEQAWQQLQALQAKQP